MDRLQPDSGSKLWLPIAQCCPRKSTTKNKRFFQLVQAQVAFNRINTFQKADIKDGTIAALNVKQLLQHKAT